MFTFLGQAFQSKNNGQRIKSVASLLSLKFYRSFSAALPFFRGGRGGGGGARGASSEACKI